ncbi:uncharacterized protein LOC135845663 isoform X2 [Planococcus citri]|uniref:uncharacterized protein LOC135845663 isoform X2 n=1 Tax=Planococcus citri TaxID=170843 RepID=UPI0031F8702B
MMVRYNRVRLNFNTKESVFKQTNHPSRRCDKCSNSRTPVGRSFKYHRGIDINLFDPTFQDLNVKLLLKELIVEPFIFKNNDFVPDFPKMSVKNGKLLL